MRAGDELLGAVFNKDHRYVIPIFQRPYVWDEEENWIPLWDDIRKAAESAETQSEEGDDEDAQEYFLGALVTQHRSPIPRRTPTSMVIDGQQRMTTFQVFLAAARRVALEFGALHAADSFAALVRNRVSADSDHPEDRLKVAPLAHDLRGFEWAVREPDDVTSPPNVGHKLVRASLWFEDAVRDWVKESSSSSDRLDFLHFAVENRIKVVSIFLDAKDDPQIIFEALNHRGVRLDAADLVKNLLFQMLDRQGDHHLEHELLNDHWSVLDSGHWREEVTTGRIKRVRVDILLAYWLSAQRGEESSVEHLFEDFKRWMRASQARAADVIRDIRVYADTMDRLQRLPMSSPIAQALDRLDATKTTTPWPLILFLHASSEIPEDQAVIGTLAIDSFLMRRAICRMTTKDYNRLFGTLLGVIKAGDITRAGDLLVAGLASQAAESRIWPDDSAFISGLMNSNLYNDLVRARLRTLLVGLENHLLTRRAEPTLPHRAATKALTIEHVMPVKWEENWSLPDGVPGSAIERRNNSIHRLGNLTLATQSLNSTLSNQAWSKKRHTLQTHSLARLTTGSILTFPEGVDAFTQDEWVSAWDEDRIGLRELALIRCALAAWPRPSEPDADFVDLEVFHATETSRAAEEPTRTDHLVHGDLLPLIVRGLVVPGDRLRHQKVRAGTEFHATVTGSGGLDTSAGHFRAPSPALSKLVGSSRNGWTDWTHVPTGKTLAELREMLRDSLRDGAENDGEADG
jgi:hypothetical protein